jgi:hypothetical protein
MGIGAEGAAQFVIPGEQRVRDGLLSGCSSLVVVLPVLDVVPSHDFYLAKIRILLPLGLCEQRESMEKGGRTFRKSTFLSSFCSWCLNCLTIVRRGVTVASDSEVERVSWEASPSQSQLAEPCPPPLRPPPFAPSLSPSVPSSRRPVSVRLSQALKSTTRAFGLPLSPRQTLVWLDPRFISSSLSPRSYAILVRSSPLQSRILSFNPAHSPGL